MSTSISDSMTAVDPNTHDPKSSNGDDMGIWERRIHPNGEIYYHNRYLRVPVVTTDDIGKPEVVKNVPKILKFYLPVVLEMDLFRKHGPHEDWDFAISDVTTKPMGTVTLQTWNGSMMYLLTVEESGIKVYEQSQEELWRHISKYPAHHPRFPRWAEIDFMTAMAYGANELAFDNKETTFPFSDHQVKRFIRVYHDLKAVQALTNQNMTPALASHIGRVMCEVESNRMKYKYGTPQARIYRDVAISKPTWAVQALDLCISFLLFGAHKTYRTRLEAAQPKGTPYLSDFRKLMQSLLTEWADSNLVATVFVSANVGFLAVPNINSLQRTASLASSLFAMTSIVTGLHHVWQHRGKTNADQDEASRYLHYVKMLGHDELDLTVTACFLSIPLASLLWSVLSFTVSIGAFCIQGSTEGHGRLLLIVLLGVLTLCACAMLVFFWHIWSSPPTSDKEEVYHLDTDLNVDPPTWTKATWKRVQTRVRTGMKKMKLIKDLKTVPGDDSDSVRKTRKIRRVG